MIARVFTAAHIAVHAGRDEPLLQWRTEQQMIDMKAGIAAERIPEIFPESVDPLSRMQSPQRVGPALRDKTAIGPSHLWAKQCIIDPSFRRINVEIGRHDIKV